MMHKCETCGCPVETVSDAKEGTNYYRRVDGLGKLRQRVEAELDRLEHPLLPEPYMWKIGTRISTLKLVLMWIEGAEKDA